MTLKKKICVVTGSRAEYGLLYFLMQEIQKDEELQLQILVTGQHLSPLFGLTYRAIEEDGFKIDEKVEISLGEDTTVGTSRAVGEAISGCAQAFGKLKPDFIVLLGDRFEILGAAIAAVLSCIPIAHIHGGELTEGSFDNSIRHAITKMSHLHFAAAEPYRKRIIRMGEPPDRVFCVGAPALNNIEGLSLVDRQGLEKELHFCLKQPFFLVTYHPETLNEEAPGDQMKRLLEALDAFPEASIIFTGTNSDPRHSAVRDWIDTYIDREGNRATFFQSLGQRLYLSLLQFVAVVIGNSSSGIIEVPSFRKPTVNIGDRQKGRIMAESIISCGGTIEEIREAIQKALSREFQAKLSCVRNPYGGGGASKRMKSILKEFLACGLSVRKGFYEGTP